MAYGPEYETRAPFAPIVVTGPNRAMAEGMGRMAAPYGDMMLSGCFGLVEALRAAEPQP